MTRHYLIEQNGFYRVITTKNYEPDSFIARVPKSIDPADWAYVRPFEEGGDIVARVDEVLKADQIIIEQEKISEENIKKDNIAKRKSNKKKLIGKDVKLADKINILWKEYLGEETLQDLKDLNKGE